MQAHGPDVASPDLFYTEVVNRYVGGARFLRRDWLEHKVEEALRLADCRFVLLRAAPGAGKTAFLAQLAADHPDWLRYFIRFDQREVLSDVSATSLLLRLGYQLAALEPTLFSLDELRLSVEQRIGDIDEGGKVTAAYIKAVVASPFRKKVIEITQQVTRNHGNVTGLFVEQFVSEPRLIDRAALWHMAILDPASALRRRDPDRNVVILVDALDEVRHQLAAGDIVSWLTECPRLPPYVRFVLTSRLDNSLDEFSARHGTQVQPIVLDPKDRDVKADGRRYLDRLVKETSVERVLTAVTSGVEGFVEKAVDKAGGNLGYLDALARGIDQSMSTDGGAIVSLLNLTKLPDEIEDLYAFFLNQIKNAVARERVELRDSSTGERYDKPVWPAVYSRILGVLAVALEPLEFETLTRLAGINAESEWVLHAINNLMQFLDVQGGRYRLYHATIPEFLTSAKTAANSKVRDLHVTAARWHREITQQYRKTYGVDWRNYDRYGVHNLPSHYALCGEVDAVRELALNIGWLQNKLHVTGVDALVRDCDLLPDDAEVRILAGALTLSARALSRDPSQLAAQLIARLARYDAPGIEQLVRAARAFAPHPCLVPVTPSLTPPGPLQHVLAGHTDDVTVITTSSDEQRLMSVSRDGAVIEWDLATRQPRKRIDLPNGVVALALSADTRRAVVLESQHLRVWDVGTDRVLLDLRDGCDDRTLCAISADGATAAFIAPGGNVSVCAVDTGVCRAAVPYPQHPVTAIALDGDGSHLLFASGPPNSSWIPWGFVVHQGRAESAVDPSNSYELPRDHLLTLWDLQRGCALLELPAHTAEITAIALARDATRALSASQDDTVHVWDLTRSQAIVTLAEYAGRVSAATLLSRKSIGFTASEDHTIKMWSLTAPTAPSTSQGHVKMVNCVALAGDGAWALSGGDDNLVRVWDTQSGSELGQLRGHTDWVRVLAVTPDGRRAISGGHDDCALYLWDLEARSRMFELRGHSDPIADIVIAPDGSYAVSGAYDRTLRQWNLSNGSCVALGKIPGGQIRSIALVGAGGVACGTADGCLWLWDFHRPVVWHRNREAEARVSRIAVTADGGILAAAYESGSLEFWNLPDRTLRFPVQHHGKTILDLAIAPTGEYAITSSGDGTLAFWDLATGLSHLVTPAHDDAVTAICFAPDAASLLTVSRDGLVVFWNAVSRQPIARFTADDGLTCCAVDRSGTTAVAGERSGRVHVLRVQTTAASTSAVTVSASPSASRN